MTRTTRLQTALVTACLAVAISSGALVACGSSSGSDGSAATNTSADKTTTTKPRPTEDYEAQAADFVNLKSMTVVRGFFVSNKLGHLDEALTIARANKGGVYPVGTIIQLVPQEAMVKRKPGWNPASKDWEFFFLDVSAKGTTIAVRGADEVENRFGGNCASCHKAAEPKFDFVCENDHGCEPLPIDHKVIESIQKADPRPL